MLLTPAFAQAHNKEKRPIFAALLKIDAGAGAKMTIPWPLLPNKPAVNGVIWKPKIAKTIRTAKIPKTQNVQATFHAKMLAECKECL